MNDLDKKDSEKKGKTKRAVGGTAIAFVLLMGIVSLFSDMTHEGATSIIGNYLALAGASAAVIGFISGLGEFVGYSLRLLTAWITDRSKRYWLMTIIGYVIDCTAIPLLALVPQNGWIWACILIVTQRMGKAIKKPAKDTLISFAASQSGTGKSFAIQEFLDQLGAVLGPVILFVVMLARQGSETYQTYSICFAVLTIPALITVILLLVAKSRFPHPENFEPPTKNAQPLRLNKTFLFYIAAICCFAFGFIDFPLITMHAAKTGVLDSEILPLLYAGAMAIDGIAALAFGWLYDRFGFKTLVLSAVLSAPFPILIFGMRGPVALFVGAALWGIGMGAQESILKAAVTDLVPKQSRSMGFGIFQTAFGVCWFLGSWLTGVLYDFAPLAMIIFSVTAQLCAIPLYLISDSSRRSESSLEHPDSQ